MALTVPRFKPLYRSRTVAGTGTFLLTETVPTVLSGTVYELVCPLIDGQRSVDDIVHALEGRLSSAEVRFALTALERRGLLEQARADLPDGAAAYWWSAGVDPRLAGERLVARPMRVEAVGEVQPGPVAEALRAAGVLVDPSAVAAVVVTDDYRRPELRAVDTAQRESAAPWVLLRPIGVQPWVGPVIDPAEGVSWGGLADRIRMNYTTDAFVEEQLGELTVTAAGANPATLAVLGIAAAEIAQWIARAGDTPLTTSLLSVEASSLRRDWHHVSYAPRTADPAQPESVQPVSVRTPEPIVFRSRPVLHEGAGGHRAVPAEETLARFSHLVSPITGIVNHLERVSVPGSPLAHAYSSSHNWAARPDSLAFLRASLRSQSGGKGTSDLQAKVGAIAEAVERYSGVYRGTEIRRRGRLRDLGPDGLHPHDVLLFSERQYERRREINAEGNAFQMVPQPFDAEQPADWSPLWSPTAQEFVWAPTGLLYYNYSKAVPADTPNRLACYADSNGCAAGNTVEEAALQALMELVERDAVASWWYNEVPRPAVQLRDVMTPYLHALLEWLESEDRELWVLDITNDIGIPAFAALSRRRTPDSNGAEQLVVGFGAHLDPAVGIMRAIVEVNQFLASLSALGSDELGKAFDPGAVQWWQTASLENKRYAAPAPGPLRRLADYPVLTSDDLAEELATAIRMIEARDLRVLLLDQTRPEAGLPVVKALVPGMRHFWSRLAPGRLYDVPVQLGWLPRPLQEEELNPTPVFF